MRIAFFGTPDWAVPSLSGLLDGGLDVALVVTNPDRPSGRGMTLSPPPVKVAAIDRGIEVYQPESARDPEVRDRLAGLRPEVCVVVAYGKILPPGLLEVPPLGFVNVHFSLLPEFRGAAPVQRAIMERRTVTGVSIMVLTEGMDEGPVLAMEEEPIAADDTAGSVGERLARRGADLLVRTLPAYARREIEPREQDHDRATYAPKITTDEAEIRWTWSSARVDAHVRGLDPAPGAWTLLEGKRLRVFRVAPAPDRNLAPGEASVEGGLFVGTEDRTVELTDVQLAGKRRMAGRELARGLRFETGVKLG